MKPSDQEVGGNSQKPVHQGKSSTSQGQSNERPRHGKPHISATSAIIGRATVMGNQRSANEQAAGR